MKIAEIRGLSEAELTLRRKAAREEAFNLRLQQQTGALEKSSRLHELRRVVAKIETVASERRLGLKIESATAGKPAATSKKTKKS
jgi:large subunit ribosomal protein L29